jgi:hypothetical protein
MISRELLLLEWIVTGMTILSSAAYGSRPSIPAHPAMDYRSVRRWKAVRRPVPRSAGRGSQADRAHALHFTLGTDLTAAHAAVLRTAVHLKQLKSLNPSGPVNTGWPDAYKVLDPLDERII